ncbi:MAG: DUF6242 domain-containing protein, partial [Candidatus Azobacteroides sp.]|nr:DUF6242 domain-containing protein [Candidatus Azobacteroides sp.]
MNLKITFYTLGVVLLSTLTSCLGSDNTEYISSSDAQILSFSITGNIVLPGINKNDTITSGLDNIIFSIDQINGHIFNQDSVQYRIILPNSVIATYTTVSGFPIYKITDGDTTLINSGQDSINLSKPLKFLSYAINGDKKEYTFNFNIHQIDPDAFWWKPVNSDLDFLNQPETKTFIFNDTFYCFTKYQIPSYAGVISPIVLHISSDKGMTWGDPIDIGMPSDIILSQMQQFGKDLFACTPSPFGYLYKINIRDNLTSWTQ